MSLKNVGLWQKKKTFVFQQADLMARISPCKQVYFKPIACVNILSYFNLQR